MTDLSAKSLATHFGASLIGPDLEITIPAPLLDAHESALTFVGDTERFAEPLLNALNIGAIVFAPLGTQLPSNATGALILVDNPRASFGLAVANHFAPQPDAGISDTARVHSTASVHETASIGEYTVIRAGAVVEAHAEIRDHVVIGRNVVVGAHSLIKSQAVVGEEGFGIEKDADGNNFHVPHIGSVRLGTYTEVGNFTTVCSGTLAPTVVGDYTKIDDHVHIAHNCQIGKNVIITACAEISGSVTIEDEVWIGPNASVIQGLTLGKDSLLGIGAVALKSIPENEVRVGNPAKRLGDNKK
ncbi:MULTISPECIES: UDP-3-O-(3-hydroxymyristoyl)glucosamine N-acyltransferase [unclassified Leucobacter]|uniref:UDP-3-O-(3-hydroxymyristoyl)glucosamine N-acyltransferase n=1 Tax=unclassified Leucobacter TaxID=2621730 RepID=UPI00165E6CB1|nr:MULTISPECIES: UDP-3-O-(3-hydroxymyristoyl)glucosamine N-acyltransferase [unclassified Leucobacter]MBC9927542.1 UDP-3-O-(3-hydroxymyristoyl)glucosamine N-acyltransferase [Leucobacter sp. cx-169]